MNKFLRKGQLFFYALFILAGCRKSEWDDYYGRPDNLAPPIYQQLQSRGNFNNLISLIEKAGYKNILGTAGYWTFFAPNDDAFKAFFVENGISGINDIDSVKAAGIVTYCLAANSYRKDQLGSLQSSNGLASNRAFRRRTAFYDFAYVDPAHSGVIVSSNRNSSYVANDNNNKYIPYFLDGYFNANGLSSSDYNAFYPSTTYAGFNVAGAKVVNADIIAENGVIHEIDKVITPLPNIDQYLAGNPLYSEFRKLLNRMATYSSNATLTARYKVLTGKTDEVFVKGYSSTIAFSPANEGYLYQTQTDAQENGWTIFAPQNDALLAYEKEILVNYGSIDAAPTSILVDLINSHMWLSTVWPKNVMTNSDNLLRQTANFSQADIVENKMLSNGIFYGLKKAQQANVFRTVYGKAYLDPKYSLMTRIFNETDLKEVSTNPNFKFTLFMMSDVYVKNAGYDYIPDQKVWSYTATSGSTPVKSASQERLARIAGTSLVSAEFNDLSGEGIGEGFNGEYVKYKANKVYASGNVANGTFVSIDSVKNSFNGKVYYTKGLLQFAEDKETLGATIERLGQSTNSTDIANFNYFYQYLSNSGSVWTPSVVNGSSVTPPDIIGAPVGGLYTVFIPTNAAIVQAVKEGRLPGNTTTGFPNFKPTLAVDQVKVADFILYHIVEKNTIAVDAKKSGQFATVLKDSQGDPRLLTVFYSGTDPGSMQIRDQLFPATTAATVNLSFSNNLGNRALIHSINKVLKF